MLHILLFILKIAGIILAVILGIVILLVCIVLFVPVRYEFEARSGGDLMSTKGKLLVTWFLRLVRVDVYYKEKRIRWRIRAAWIKKTGGQKKEGTTDEEAVTEEAESEENEEISEDSHGIQEEQKGLQESESTEETRESKESKGSEEKPGEDPGSEYGKEYEESREKGRKCMEEALQEEPEAGPDGETVEDAQTAPKERTGIFGKIQGAVKKVFEKIKELFRKIGAAFQKICKKLRDLAIKKERIVEFIQDEVHVDAFHRAKREVFRLLGRLNPRRLVIQARFGFGDPCITGQVLAVLSILYPFTGDHMMVTPDFERRVLEGHIDIKGKVYGYYFLLLLWNLLLSRSVRRTYKDIRNFNFKDQEESLYGRV